MRSHLNYFSSVCVISLCMLSRFFITFGFHLFEYAGVSVVLCYSCLRFSEPLKSVHLCLSPNLSIFRYFFSALASPSGFQVLMLNLLILSHSHRLCYLQPFFSFSDWIISIVLSSNLLTLFLVISITLLSLSNV